MKKLDLFIAIVSMCAVMVAAYQHSAAFAVIGACGFILCAGRAPMLPYERPRRGSSSDHQ